MRAGEYSGDSGVHYVEADWNPLCPFGYGLTYTTFVCSDLQIEGGSLSACEVEEGGAGMRVLHCYEQRGCFGEETAQVYLRDMVSGTVKPVKERADLVIDTTRLSTGKLRQELLGIFGGEKEKGGMAVNVASFGFKYGLPLEADLVFDVRFMPNPFYIEELRHQTGLDKPVADYVFGFPQTQDFLNRLRDLLAFTLPLYAEEGKTGLFIGVGCTGGHHRSVAVAHALAEYIRSLGYQTAEHHRDMERSV